MISNHVLEFLECDLVVMVNIVLIHDIFNFLSSHLMTKFGECISQSGSC